MIKKAIFLIHGFCGSSLNMKLMEEYFKNKGYYSYSFDLPGHGDDYMNFEKNGKKDWILKVKEEFNKFKNFNQIVIAGFSMGSCLALILFESLEPEYKEKVKLILLSPALSINKNIFPSFLLTILGSSLNQRFKIKSQNPGCNHPRYKSYYKNHFNYISYRKVFELYLLIIKSRKILKKINQPILLIQSIKDKICGFDNILKFLNNLKKSKKNSNYNKILTGLNKSNHFIIFDYEFDLVCELIILYLENSFTDFIKNEKVKLFLN